MRNNGAQSYQLNRHRATMLQWNTAQPARLANCVQLAERILYCAFRRMKFASIMSISILIGIQTFSNHSPSHISRLIHIGFSFYFYFIALSSERYIIGELKICLIRSFMFFVCCIIIFCISTMYWWIKMIIYHSLAFPFHVQSSPVACRYIYVRWSPTQEPGSWIQAARIAPNFFRFEWLKRLSWYHFTSTF